MDATTAPTAVEMLDELKAAGVRVLSSAHLPEIRSMVAQLRAERAAASAVVSVGWDGACRPMWRYRADLSLPDHARRIVAPEDRPEW